MRIDDGKGVCGSSLLEAQCRGREDRLQEKGFISSKLGAATAKTGNRQMKYYSVEAAGQAVLQESERTRERMMVGVLLPVRGMA